MEGQGEDWPFQGEQNVYDIAEFFESYRSLRDRDTGLNAALERPSLIEQLPSLAGLRVLDLGCGFGDFARWARSQGARNVLGVDISRRMLDEATRRTSDCGISFLQSSIESFGFQTGSFELVVSSLTLHYVKDFQTVAANVFDCLSPGGLFLFSVEHPICTAHPIGLATTEQGCAFWPVDRYAEEGSRQTNWFVEGVVKFHRTIESYVTAILKSGFQLCHLGEPSPSPEAVLRRPDLKVHCVRPPLLVLAARKPPAK